MVKFGAQISFSRTHPPSSSPTGYIHFLYYTFQHLYIPAFNYCRNRSIALILVRETLAFYCGFWFRRLALDNIKPA